MLKYPVSYLVLLIWFVVAVSSVLQACTPNIIIVLTALSAIRRCSQSNRPFFLFIATNAPHDPLHDAPEGLYQEYLSQGNNLRDFPVVKNGFPIQLQEDNEPDRLARFADPHNTRSLLP